MCTTCMQYPWRPKEGRADRHVEKKRRQTVSLEFGQRRDCVATGLDEYRCSSQISKGAHLGKSIPFHHGVPQWTCGDHATKRDTEDQQGERCKGSSPSLGGSRPVGSLGAKGPSAT